MCVGACFPPLFSSNARIVDCFAPLARYGNNRYRGASLPSLALSHWSLQMTIANRDACDMRDILIDPISQAQRVCVCVVCSLSIPFTAWRHKRTAAILGCVPLTSAFCTWRAEGVKTHLWTHLDSFPHLISAVGGGWDYTVATAAVDWRVVWEYFTGHGTFFSLRGVRPSLT